MLLKPNCKVFVLVFLIFSIFFGSTSLLGQTKDSFPKTRQQVQRTPDDFRFCTSQKRYFEAKATFWKTLTCLFSLFFTIGITIWICHINHVTKPFTAMRKDLDFLRKDIGDLKKNFRELEQYNRSIEVRLAEVKTALDFLELVVLELSENEIF